MTQPVVSEEEYKRINSLLGAHFKHMNRPKLSFAMVLWDESQPQLKRVCVARIGNPEYAARRLRMVATDLKQLADQQDGVTEIQPQDKA